MVEDFLKLMALKEEFILKISRMLYTLLVYLVCR